MYDSVDSLQCREVLNIASALMAFWLIFSTCLGIKSRSGLWQVHPPYLDSPLLSFWDEFGGRRFVIAARARSLPSPTWSLSSLFFEGHIFEMREQSVKSQKSLESSSSRLSDFVIFCTWQNWWAKSLRNEFGTNVTELNVFQLWIICAN